MAREQMTQLRLTQPQRDLLAEIKEAGVLYIQRYKRYYRTAEALVKKGLIEVCEPDHSRMGQDGYRACRPAVAERWWKREGKPWDGRFAPPPWPTEDYRNSNCVHGFDGKWGEKGERQRQCRECGRWIWEHLWPKEEAHLNAATGEADG